MKCSMLLMPVKPRLAFDPPLELAKLRLLAGLHCTLYSLETTLKSLSHPPVLTSYKTELSLKLGSGNLVYLSGSRINLMLPVSELYGNQTQQTISYLFEQLEKKRRKHFKA